MEAIVHDEIDANPNRLDEETLFREGIRLQQTPAKRSDRLLIFGVFSVQWREIEIRRNIGDVLISHIRPENVCQRIRSTLHGRNGFLES